MTTDSLEELSRINNELVNLQRELSKKNQLLERLNQQKNAFLGMAAHDLRNPISSVGGYARLLLEVDVGADERRHALESIGRVADHMLILVNDLLDVSVIESGKLELRREPVDLAKLLGERLQFFRLLARKKEITLDEEIDGLTLRLDPGRTVQVIDNLVSNAVKYSPQDTRIQVSLRAGEQGSASLVVRDDGPGISAEEQTRLFGAFERLSSRPTGGEKSSGLGLAICKELIDLHNGEIGVRNNEGPGATFWFRLPAAPVAPGEGDE